MKTTGKIVFTTMIVIVAVAIAIAQPRRDGPDARKSKQIVVLIHRSPNGLEYEMRSYHLKKGDANYWLAEIKLRECTNCQVIPIIDDDVPLGAITQISEMAINAGFTDIRPFIYWKKTGNMAEIQFGPPVRFTPDPQKIEKRIEKAR